MCGHLTWPVRIGKPRLSAVNGHVVTYALQLCSLAAGVFSRWTVATARPAPAP